MKLPDDLGLEIGFLVLVICATVAACYGHEGFAMAFLAMALMVAV